jgi:hypothetical protein
LEFFCYKVFANKRKNALYYTTGEELWEEDAKKERGRRRRGEGPGKRGGAH